VSALLPEGVSSLADAPYTLVDAITMGLGFLGFEEHAPEDRPPKRIWQDPERLKAHWAAVRKRWKAGGGGEQEIEDPVDNAAAAGLIVGG
jgi:hypothetical protein